MRRYRRRPPKIDDRIVALLGDTTGMCTRDVAWRLNMSVPEATRRLGTLYRQGRVKRAINEGRIVWSKP